MSYKTIYEEAQDSFIEKKSEFIGHIAPVKTADEAVAFIERIRSENRKARHNVYAYILRDKNTTRYSDDGEPQRTSGMPTLEVLRGAGLENVCCVTTRYFGGTLLGPGGLVRAYTAAAQNAVAAAREAGQIVTMTMVTKVTCVIPYSAYGRVERLVADCRGKVHDTVFAEDVQMNCVFVTGDEVAFASAMLELANGEDLCRVGEPTFAEF